VFYVPNKEEYRHCDKQLARNRGFSDFCVTPHVLLTDSDSRKFTTVIVAWTLLQ